MQLAAVVGLPKTIHPLGRGGEQHAVPGLTGPNGQTDGQVGLPGSRGAEEDDVLLGLDEVEGPEVGHHVPLEAALVVEVELLQGLAGRESGGPDADLPTVGLAGGHLPLQAGGQELLVGPVLSAARSARRS